MTHFSDSFIFIVQCLEKTHGQLKPFFRVCPASSNLAVLVCVLLLFQSPFFKSCRALKQRSLDGLFSPEVEGESDLFESFPASVHHHSEHAAFRQPEPFVPMGK